MTGITFAYSYIVIPPLLTHAAPTTLAQQWLQAYQYGPGFIRPLILTGTLSNALLAYFSPSRISCKLYTLAALLTFSIIPYTILYMEPGINGAGKWKAEKLLKEQGVRMEENGKGMPSAWKHTATEKCRMWAERRDMREIVGRWGVVNGRKWMISGVAAVLSGVASCCRWKWK